MKYIQGGQLYQLQSNGQVKRLHEDLLVIERPCGLENEVGIPNCGTVENHITNDLRSYCITACGCRIKHSYSCLKGPGNDGYMCLPCNVGGITPGVYYQTPAPGMTPDKPLTQAIYRDFTGATWNKGEYDWSYNNLRVSGRPILLPDCYQPIPDNSQARE